MNILEIQEVTKIYAGHTALDHVTIHIPEQSVFGLLGPNGAGKTSLIRIITQITGPDSGKILFRGEPLNEKHIGRMGYLPEERGLYKKMEVGEQALYLARLKGLSRQDAMKKLKYWFEKFEIQSWWKKKIEELSKGMAQKVQFITTIIHEPEFLILDEPFTGFDPINAELIKNELLDFRKRGATIVLSTHRMESVEELCSHIALINHARVILEGSVREIRQTYKSNVFEVFYTGNKIAFTNALWSGFELLDIKEDTECNVAQVKMLNGNSVNDLLGLLLPHVSIQGLREIIPGMNDIFIRTVNETMPQKSVA
ncbi:MAG: ATP-binding cassette domain-containing protein [Bacteroidia bacterium]|nr:ATP-binding cassette domain-containing protein [Bacteroidia bacterium]